MSPNSSPPPSRPSDHHAMSASRLPSKTAPPTPSRDGIHLIPQTPITYDENLTQTHNFTDITYQISTSTHCARIAFNRPNVLHSFRPQTINQLRKAFEYAQDDIRVGVILLDSEVDPTTRTPAFCAGGDQNFRDPDLDGGGGYYDGTESVPRLRVLDLQVQMRRCPKPIIAIVRGYAIGGGHILHMVCDLTIASEDAVFGQTGPRMGSFDAGYGSVHMSRLVGPKKAGEMWYLCKYYSAKEAMDMGLVNRVCKKEELDGVVGQWVRRMVTMSPTALACVKAALNADQDGSMGVSLMGGHLTRLFYHSEEGKEGLLSFKKGRAPNFRGVLQSRL